MSDFNQKDLLNLGEMYKPVRRSLEPPVDKEVSKIVGHKVLALDPLLIKVVMKHKTNNPDKFDNLFLNQAFIRDLKKTFNSVI